MESGPGRSKDNCSHQLNFLEGVHIPLYGNRAGKSFELVWFLLHACLILVLTEFHLVCFCLCCVRVLSVWAPCVAWFVCFAILGSSFPAVCMWGFCLGTRGGLVFAVKLQAPSLPQGWLLHSHCAAPLAIPPPPLPPSLSLPRTAVMVCVCWSNTPTWVQQRAAKNWNRLLSLQGYYQWGGLELLLRSWMLSEWTHLTISWMFLSSARATGCVTQKRPTET